MKNALAGIASARIVAYYLSRDRVLGLLNPRDLTLEVLGALRGHDAGWGSAILSNVVGTYVLNAMASNGVKTLQQLVFDNALLPGAFFVYNGHFFGKGFGLRNTRPELSLTEKLDGPLEGKSLVFQFAKDGLINDTAYSRLSGSTRLFAFGYIASIDGDIVRAVPYVIGDLVDNSAGLPISFEHGLEMQPEEIAQFAAMDRRWIPTKTEFESMRDVPEAMVKELICGLLNEFEIPNDWGGEESDLFTSNLEVDGKRISAAFLLKGPAKFHAMTPKDLGKNGDQLYRLFNIPAQVFVIQHCHTIGAAVRKTAAAFALSRAFSAPCRLVFMDGFATAQLLRAHGRWPTDEGNGKLRVRR